MISSLCKTVTIKHKHLENQKPLKICLNGYKYELYIYTMP